MSSPDRLSMPSMDSRYARTTYRGGGSAMAYRLPPKSRPPADPGGPLTGSERRDIVDKLGMEIHEF